MIKRHTISIINSPLSIDFGSKQIDFRLEFSNRKSLGITVKPDLYIIVKAPVGTALEKVKEKIRKKAPWILKQQSFFLNFHPKTPERKFVGGETHLYLGRQYQLKIVIIKKKIIHEDVKLKGQFMEVYTGNKTKVREIIKSWYMEKAKEKLRTIAQPLIEKFKKHKVEPSSVILREMKTRWGSCTSKKKIILNPELIKAPKGCIEYVIVHELCHLIHHDHTQKFVDLQTKEMPDWEKWKMKLEKLLA